jgi:hypothetical protein
VCAFLSVDFLSEFRIEDEQNISVAICQTAKLKNMLK